MTIKKVLLWGWYGFENLGDDLLLDTMLQHLQGEITVPMNKSYALQNVNEVYVYIADAVSALIKILLDGVDGEAYNISDDDDGRTLRGYAEYLATLSNQKVKFEIEDNSAVSKATFALMDTTKLKDLGWKPLYTVCQGLKETYTIKQQDNFN